MARSAEDILKVAIKKRSQLEKAAHTRLKDKCISAVTSMMNKGDLTTEIELTDADLRAVSSVASELRDLGYRYCLIEREDSDGFVTEYRFRISLSHLSEATV